MDTKPEKTTQVKGATRILLIEALRQLEKQSCIEICSQDRVRSHPMELYLDTTILGIKKLLDGAVFFDDDKPLNLDLLMNQLHLDHMIEGRL